MKLTHLILHQAYQVLLGVVRRIGLEPANVAHSLASATGKPLLPLLLLLHQVYLLLHLVVRLDVTGAQRKILDGLGCGAVMSCFLSCTSDDDIELLLIVATIVLEVIAARIAAVLVSLQRHVGNFFIRYIGSGFGLHVDWVSLAHLGCLPLSYQN